MKISIVTISYNQGAFVERTIRSVLDQDYSEIEYIVVDPGSTDGSRDIIERYRDRISTILFEPDKGPADGLNKGFMHAHGEVFGFLNSDDVLLPGALGRVASYFSARPETDVLMGNTLILNEQGEMVRRSYTDKFDPRVFAYSGGVFCQQGTFFRAELFRESGGFNPANVITWDGELFLDLLLRAKHPLYVGDFLGGFRIHGNSITGANKMRDEFRAYRWRTFARIMGRPWRTTDWLFWFWYRLRKYLMNPRAFIERLRHGTIGGI